MTVLACAGCKRLISESMADGANPVALEDLTIWSLTKRQCPSCRVNFCSECAPVLNDECPKCKGPLPGPTGRIGSADDTLDTVAERLAMIVGVPVRSYSTFDFGRDQDNASRSIVVGKHDALRLVARLWRLLPRGFFPFVGTTRWLGKEKLEGQAEVVFAKGKWLFDAVRIARTEPVNHGLTTEDVIARLAQYHKAYGVEIWEAESDSLKFRLRKMPESMTEFCEDLAGFCPDLLDMASAEELATQIVEAKGWIDLWWD